MLHYFSVWMLFLGSWETGEYPKKKTLLCTKKIQKLQNVPTKTRHKMY